MNTGKSKQKVVLVSGGGKGIGKAIISAYAKEGAKIAFFDIDGELVKQVKSSLDKINADFLAEVIDVTDTDKIAVFVDRVRRVLGSVDILVNNVGLGVTKRFSQTTLEDLEHVWKTNFEGPFFLTQRILENMKAGSNVIFITSIHAQHPSLDPSYDCSKAAINTLIVDLALEYAKQGIRVNGIALGHIDVNTTDQPRLQEDVPLGKAAGLPEDIAQACMILTDNTKSRYITGEILHVTGGLHIPIAKDLKF